MWSTGSTQHRMCLVDTNLAGLRNHPKISGERRVEDRPSIDGPNGSLEQVRKRGEQRVRKKQAKQKKESEKKKGGTENVSTSTLTLDHQDWRDGEPSIVSRGHFHAFLCQESAADGGDERLLFLPLFPGRSRDDGCGVQVTLPHSKRIIKITNSCYRRQYLPLQHPLEEPHHSKNR